MANITTRYGQPGENKNNYRHGHASAAGVSRTYSIWRGMIQRCTNPSVGCAKYYYAKGISVCERWLSFKNFLADVGECPGPEYSLDRCPNRKGNYEPGNVRWATGKEQSRNRDDRKLYDYRGELYMICELVELSGLPFATLQARILNYGWDIIRAVETPVTEARQYVHAGRSMTLSEWADHLGKSVKFLEKRLSLGWSFERAVTEPQTRQFKPTYTHNGLTMTMQEWVQRTGKTKATILSRMRRGASFADAIEMP